jgi:hypothetical protein
MFFRTVVHSGFNPGAAGRFFLWKASESFQNVPSALQKASKKCPFLSDYFPKFPQVTETYQRLTDEKQRLVAPKILRGAGRRGSGPPINMSASSFYQWVVLVAASERSPQGRGGFEGGQERSPL